MIAVTPDKYDLIVDDDNGMRVIVATIFDGIKQSSHHQARLSEHALIIDDFLFQVENLVVKLKEFGPVPGQVILLKVNPDTGSQEWHSVVTLL